VAEGFGELRLGGVTRRFGAAVALDRLDLTIRRGEFIAVLGPSGCGKSTALNCIAGLLPLSGGGIWLDDKRIDVLRPEQRGFGMVFQNYALFPHMSVRQNVGFGLRMRGVPSAQVDARVARALELVQLRGHEEKLPGQLSGGQQQRVAIARAIVVEPPLVLMDEPLSNLDARLRLEMRAEIRRIHRSLGRATIYVTHDQEEALSMADRIVVMKEGGIEQIGSPAEVYLDPATPFVADFVGKTNLLPAQPAGDGCVQVGAQRLECDTRGANGQGGLRVFFRPEAVQVRGVNGATPNSADAVIEKVEFLGAYSRLTFRLAGIDQPLYADLSVNDMTWFRLKQGDTLRVSLPPERLRVFEAP